ncbi:MAG: M3 family oligoendopeptidase [Bacteroidota bacterium]
MQQFLEVTDARASRTFVPPDFLVESWEGLKIHFDFLLEQSPQTLEELEAFLRQRNELEALVAEDVAWRYIKMTCNTQDKNLESAYQYFITEILPHLSVYDDKLNRKIAAHPYFDQLPSDPYLTFARQLQRSIELFREDNVPLLAKSHSISQQHGSMIGSMTIEHEGETLTLQQAGKLLEKRDRDLRQSIWEKVAERRKQDWTRLQDIFGQLLDLRHQIAINADYPSYTRYKFDQLGRFDYQPEDVVAFHESVSKAIRPMYERFLQERKEKLQLNELRPWDLHVDIFGDTPLKPFVEAPELLQKSIEVLGKLKPELGQMLQLMDRMGYLDLGSRVGKAPGGYNYPLLETGVPFIFMNATGTQADVTTMLHESGHAIHSFVTRDIPLNALKQTPSEVAELASMTMELLCLDHYDEFYPDEKLRLRAKKEQLMRCITILPWIATVDAFQQWVYNHPTHSEEERNQTWTELYYQFHGHEVNWEGYEGELAHLWLKQGHIFDVPFYYIEYAIAQLGAIGIWRNYRQDPEKALQQYLDALKLGYTKSIPQIYDAAGIRFDFSADYILDCMQFCLDEYRSLSIEDLPV